ncbi:MAG: hypothetical protein MHMPM18_004385, partial [Marteilia pararefringens]
TTMTFFQDPVVRLRSQALIDESICVTQKQKFRECEERYNKYPDRARPCLNSFFDLLNCVQPTYQKEIFKYLK